MLTPRGWLLMSSVVTVISAASMAWGVSSASSVLTAQTIPNTATAASPPPEQSFAADDALESEKFRRWALNALLVPLLDDSNPPRWTQAGIDFFCGPSTQAEIDGHRLVDATLVPGGSFTLRWQIDQCWPLGFDDQELSGVTELRVTRYDGGFSAVVNAGSLRVVSANGRARFQEPFGAWMLVDTSNNGP